jgi:hypothetical protein
MSRPSKAERDADILAEAKSEFDVVARAQQSVRMECLEDRRFASVAGAQYEGQWYAAFANKPRPEVNKVALGCLRIENEYRNNEVAARFLPKDDRDDTIAETCAALYRADSLDSHAQLARFNAFSEGMRGGMGAVRLCTAYADEDNPDDKSQVVQFKPVFEADSCVYYDLEAKRQDKADAKRCWLLTGMSRQGYMDEWGDDPATWPRDVQMTYFDWCTAEVVYVAEYYKVEVERYTKRVFEGFDGDRIEYEEDVLEDSPEILDTLIVTGFREVEEKKLKRKRVHKWILSGGKVLKDCGYIAGTCIPIVPFYGQRYYIDGNERFHGHVRMAKDAQRLANMVRAKLAEYAARTTQEKPIFTPSQISNPLIKQLWETDNTQDFPYLLAEMAKDDQGNVVNGGGPVGYTKAPNIPPALAALAQLIEGDLQEVLGNQANAEEIVSNVSGKAVELVQQRLDMQAFIYMSNYAVTERRCAEVWLSMQRDIRPGGYERLKGMGKQGEMEYVELGTPAVDDEGQEFQRNDLANAYAEVVVDVGPSSASRRTAIVRDLTSMLAVTKDPQTAAALENIILYNMDGEGMAEYRPYFRKKLLRAGMAKPTPEEAEELAAEQQNQGPDANQEFLMAEAAKARANAGLAVAKTGQAQAETAKTIAETDGEQQEQTLKTLQAVMEVQQQPLSGPV